MGEVRPGYYAVIPADVRYDDRISDKAKLLYGEIAALIGAEGFCFASNAYFARLYGVTERTVSASISALQDHGYVHVVQHKDPNTGQVTKRQIYLKVSSADGRPVEEIFYAPRKYFRGGVEENFQENNLSLSSLEKENKKEKAGRKKPSPLTDEQLHDLVVTGISTMAAPEWSRETKNEIYRLVMSLYDPERDVRKSHPVRSEISVNATFRKLLLHSQGNPKVMLDMLYSAINGGWQGVQPPGNSSPAKTKPPREERQYQCL